VYGTRVIVDKRAVRIRLVCLSPLDTYGVSNFLCCVLWLNDTSYSKASEGTNRNMPARNTLVKLLAVYTNPESHNAQRHRQTDGQQDGANRRSYCVAVRSAKTDETTGWTDMGIKSLTAYKSINCKSVTVPRW